VRNVILASVLRFVMAKPLPVSLLLSPSGLAPLTRYVRSGRACLQRKQPG